jgi:hypothetical protein
MPPLMITNSDVDEAMALLKISLAEALVDAGAA